MGKYESETAASVLGTPKNNLGLISFAYFLADKQAEARAAFFRGVKRLKNLLLLFWGHPGTLVDDVKYGTA